MCLGKQIPNSGKEIRLSRERMLFVPIAHLIPISAGAKYLSHTDPIENKSAFQFCRQIIFAKLLKK